MTKTNQVMLWETTSHARRVNTMRKENVQILHAKAGRVQLKSDGTRWRTGGEVKGKLANGVRDQYSSHYFGT
jgi:hypothetical protein